MSDPEILLPRLHERDIDCLIQEELIFNEALRGLIGRCLNLSATPEIRQCALSVVDATGETDVYAFFSVGARTGVLLIENKIDAQFQPRQAERYRERAAHQVASAKCDVAYCLLIAPTHYGSGSDGQMGHFDAIVSYEQIADAIAIEGTPRAKYRAAVLRQAVNQARSSYIVAPDANVTDLWTRVYQIASRDFAELKMKPPDKKGSQSSWIIFKGNLSGGITIDWKILKGRVDLSFWPSARHHPNDKFDLAGLPEGTKVEMLGRTVALTAPTYRPPAAWIDLTEEQIRTALNVARTLLQFYNSNPTYFS